MHRLKGERLYVNLSAAEARARLSGRGLGVRKVYSAGHHPAVVIHTAAGRHLVALQNLFADVGWATSEAGLARADGGREGFAARGIGVEVNELASR